MSCSIHFNPTSIPGYGLPDGRCLPCSGVSSRAMGSPTFSCYDYKFISNMKFLSLKCASKHTSSICNANSNSYRRSPDSSRQNKHGFSRNRNSYNGDEDFEDSENFSSSNGPLLTVSGNQKFQATATPGHREKEIVELFRKVQSQLRERATIKGERKIEDSPVKSKENETVDSLLKLLRKHSVQGKKNYESANRDFILDQPEQVLLSTGKRSTNVSDSNNSINHEMQEIPSPHLGRPKSSFHKRSPVPEIKFQPTNDEGPVDSVSQDSLDGRRQRISLEQEADIIHKLSIDSDLESEVEPHFSERNMFEEDETLEDETFEIYEGEPDVEEMQNLAETSNLTGMKLIELRALAKSRGMKGFSKLKKNELIDLLSGSSI